MLSTEFDVHGPTDLDVHGPSKQGLLHEPAYDVAMALHHCIVERRALVHVAAEGICTICK